MSLPEALQRWKDAGPHRGAVAKCTPGQVDEMLATYKALALAQQQLADIRTDCGLAFERLRDVDDEGPSGMGWQSNDLASLCYRLEQHAKGTP